MSYIGRHRVTLTTDGSGDAVGYTPVLNGEIRQIVYTKTDYADTVDFVVSVDVTGEIIWDEDNVTASASRAPRIATHSNAGVAALYAGGGSAVLDRVAVGRSRVKIVVANGGASKVGTFDVIVG
jgi:hypothetical protein